MDTPLKNLPRSLFSPIRATARVLLYGSLLLGITRTEAVTTGISADADATTKDFITGIIQGSDPNSNTDDLPYRLFVPTHYDPAKKYPLVYFFHGQGEYGTNNQSQLDGIPDPLVFVTAENREKHPAFMLAPQTPVKTWVDALRREQKEELLQQILSEYNIDPDRIYVTGISLGGNSTWDFVNRNSGQIAAMVPVCGWGPNHNIQGIPVWALHAGNDRVIDPTAGNGTDANIQETRNNGDRAIYTRYDEGGHAIWSEAYATPPLVDWMFSQRRGQQSMTLPFVEMTLVRVGATLSAEGFIRDSSLQTTQVSWESDAESSGIATGTDTWTVSDVPLRSGDNLINIIASGTDFAPGLAGGSTTFNAPIVVNDFSVPSGDETPPMLTIATPVATDGGYLTTLDSITISGTASDNVGVTNVVWSSDRGFSGSGVGTSSWTANDIPLLSGVNFITITVFDNAGNYAQAFLRVWQNEPPAPQDDTLATYQDVAVDLPVLLNDSDPDESPTIVRLLSVDAPQHGQARLYDGVIRYRPDPGFSGEDSFTYTVTDGFENATAAVSVIVGDAYPAPQTALFAQDFDASSLLGDYYDASAPNGGQWNNIGANADGGNWSIDNGVLKLVRANSTSSANGAGLMRWTDLSPTPQVIRMTFDVGFLNTPNVKNTLAHIDIGSFGDEIVGYNADTPSYQRSARLEIAGNTTGRFRFGIEGDRRGDYPSDGSLQTVSWYVNTTSEAAPFIDPNGVVRTIDAGSQSLFVGVEPLIENVSRRYPNTSPVDMRLRVAVGGDFTMLLDNFTISHVESLPDNLAPVVDAGAAQTVAFGVGVSLTGTVDDDGLPLYSVPETLWSKVSGPGSVVFADPAAAVTTATFSETGEYELRLLANDGELSGSDSVTIIVENNDPYNDWQGEHFTEQELGDPAISSDEADPDSDGLSNLIEYALGHDPKEPSAVSRPAAAFDGAHLSFLFKRIPARTDLIYEVIAADGLSGPWTVIARSVGGAPFLDVDGGTESIAETGSEVISVSVVDATPISISPSGRFMRLRIIRNDGP
ncbi:Ig-like domain-containing protein [Cerasicoccus fimbriatus]|uniref:Ig-like domain-containing protein n=1 Tax=Cerasicoccus fimbriatus TaxID=3014554 RepID=UPI0022B5D111|nr:Ig-like domain-containing protein [Cerasicoccus sp. TK19100]